MSHVPVLLHESIDGLSIKKGDTFVDATLGAGGHSSSVAKAFGDSISMIGFDLDHKAIELARQTVTNAGGTITPINANFRHMDAHIKEADKILFDLGVSSMEFGKSGRGFTFTHDEPLLMTLASKLDADTLTAGDIVNSTREEELADIIYRYGEERFSRKIAKAIVDARKKKRIETSGELAKIVESVIPRRGRIHPATKTFQAIRIVTNDELGALTDGLIAAWKILKPHGRIAVITFHSLEDRIVKNLFKELAKEHGILITKKPIVPSRTEITTNPRARSAKLRIIEKK